MLHIHVHKKYVEHLTNIDILFIVELKPVEQIKPLTVCQIRNIVCQTTVTEVTSNKCS